MSIVRYKYNTVTGMYLKKLYKHIDWHFKIEVSFYVWKMILFFNNVINIRIEFHR